MPTPIGEFISSHVYGSRLKSQHHERSSSCLALVDAGFGSVEEKSGTSWMVRELSLYAHVLLFTAPLCRTRGKSRPSFTWSETIIRLRISVSSLPTTRSAGNYKMHLGGRGYLGRMFSMSTAFRVRCHRVLLYLYLKVVVYNLLQATRQTSSSYPLSEPPGQAS